MGTLRFTTAGESHGPGLVAIVEGLPAGLELDRERIDREMARRQLGHGRGGRMKIERDAVEVRSGVRHGRTLGSPIALLVANRDYANWEERMNPWPVEAEVEESHLPRPGHADLVGSQKYGFTDVRNVLERASARETAARVAAGAIAKEFLAALGVSVHSHVLRIASVSAPERDDLAPEDFAGGRRVAGARLDPEAGERMVAEIDRLRKANESLGGVFEVRAFGLVPGLGSHVSWEERLDGRLAQAVVSIQAVKGVSVGEAWEVAGLPGSESHDEIFWSEERGYFRETNRAGGVEGGMSNGEPLVVRGALKPISTLTKPLRSVDTETKEPAQAMRERTDSTVVPAAGVVAEAMVALVLARLLPREVRRRPHRRRPGRRSRRTGSGSIGAGRRIASTRARLHRLHGGGQVEGRRAARATPGSRRSTPTLELERELGMPIADFFDAEGEAEFRGAARRSWCVELLDRGRRRRDGARRRQRALRTGARGARAAHVVVWLEVGADEAWSRVEGSVAPAGARPRALRRAATPSATPIYESLADAVVPARRDVVRAGAARPARARRPARGRPAGLGDERLGRVPGVRRRGRSLGALRRRRRDARFCVTDTTVGAAVRRPRRARSRRTVEVPPGEAAKTLARGRARCCASCADSA